MTDSEVPPPDAQRRSLLRSLLITLAVFIVLALAAWILVPRVVRAQLDKAFAEIFVQPPSLERIGFNPLTLTFTAEGFRLPARGVEVASFEKLSIGIDIFSPFRGALTLRDVELIRPDLRLALEKDGSLNVAHLLKPQPAPPPSAKPAEPPSLRFLRVALVSGMVDWKDRTRTPVFAKRVDSLDITLRDFRTKSDANNNYQLEAQTPDGERVAWRGTFKMVPFTSAGHLDVEQLRAHTLDDLLGALLPFSLADGEIDVGAHYAFDGAQTPPSVVLDSLDVTLRDFSLADHVADSTGIRVARATTRGGRVEPGAMRMNLGAISVDGMKVAAWLQNDGQLNLARWGEPVPGAPVDTAGPWTVMADSVSARGVEMTIEDRRLPGPATFRIIGATASLRGMTTAPDSTFPIAFACSTGAGGYAHAEGRLGLTPPVADLQLAVDGYDLRVLQPYIDVFASLELTRGAVDATGRLRFDALAKHGPMMRFEGGASVRDLQTRDLDLKQDFITWKRLNLTGLEYSMVPTRMTIKDIEAVGPYIRAVVAPDRTTNLQHVLTPPGPIPAAFAATTDTPLVKIDRVRVRGGSAYFSDLSLQPGFTTGMDSLSGTITGLSSVAQTGGEIEIAGKVDRYAPVSITGKIDPLGGAGKTDIHLDFKHIELTTFTPYAGKFAGYRIRKGKLSLNLRYQVEGKKLLGENKVFIEQFTLGERVDSPDATHLPVRFAIALLKDKDGNIDLDIPVHGNLDDPKFSVFRILLKVLMNLVVKAVSSPFHLIGALVGGGESADLEGVEFDAGQTALDASATTTLDQLAKALAERPALRLEIEEMPDSLKDAAALALAHYEKQLTEALTPEEVKAGATPGSLSPEARAALIERAYVKAFGPMPKPKEKRGRGAAADSAALAAQAIRVANMDQRLRQSASVTPDEIHALARARVLAIKDGLLKRGVTEDRLFIVTSASPTWKPAEGENYELEDAAADSSAAGGSSAAATSAAPPEGDPRRVRVRLALTGE